MNWKGPAALVAALVVVAALALLLLSPPQQPAAQGQPQAGTNGSAQALELGAAGEYGYLTFSYAGSGNVTLIALDEQPKTHVIVLRKDYLNTERYSYFMDSLRQLEQKGFSISEVDDFGAPNNTILVIPSGAMPESLLARLDSLAAANRIIYVGKKDLVFSDRLQHSEWLQNVSNRSLGSMTVVDRSLEEFYSERNFTLFEDLERNSWAEANSTTAYYSGSGTRTIFLGMNGARWLRMLPLADSGMFAPPKANITGTDSIFQWETAALTVQLNFTTGISQYSVEKDGSNVTSGELDRVRGAEAFFIPLSFQGPGDYLVRVSDESGTLGARRVHVKDLNISLANAYGNYYEFSVLLDGQPLEGARAVVGLNHSDRTLPLDVKNGRLAVPAALRLGENVFVISLFGHRNYLPYDNSQEGVLQFYAKYLTLGIVLIAGFYTVLRINRRPSYRILVPESSPGKNPEISLSAKDVLSAMEAAERSFGWNKVPLYAKEIGAGLKKFSSGMEVNEGNVESIMKKMEKRGLVGSRLGLYGASGWGDTRQGALRRIVRDKLVQNGLDFSENPDGFRCRDWTIVLSPEKAGKDSIAVFEDREQKRAYLNSLAGKERAAVDLRIANGVLRLATLDELDGLL